MKTNHRHYILLIFAIAAIILSILGDIFLYRSIKSRAIQSSNAANELALEDQKKARAQDLASIYAKSQSDRALINTFIVSQDKIVTFIEALEGVGTHTGTALDISAIDSGETVPSASAGALAIGNLKAHIDVRGSWTNIMRSLMLIENLPYSSSVNNIKLIQSSDSGTGELSKIPSGQAVIGIGSRPWKLSLDIMVLTSK